MKIKAFVVMLGKFGRIESLDFELEEERWDEAVNDLIVMGLAKKYPGLKSLHLSYCDEVTDDGVSKIGEGCRQLRSLELSYCRAVSDVGISKIGEGCPELRSLHLEDCHKVRGQPVASCF